MSDKKNFIIRIDNGVYDALKKWASDDFRSVNGHIEYLLNKALKEHNRVKHVDSDSKVKPSISSKK